VPGCRAAARASVELFTRMVDSTARERELIKVAPRRYALAVLTAPSASHSVRSVGALVRWYGCLDSCTQSIRVAWRMPFAA
jgi:hypothetical protein